MIRLLGVPLLALVLATSLSGAALAQGSNYDGLDTTKLPRVPGYKEIYAFPHSTSFTTADSVADTAETVTKVLMAEGWKPYEKPFSAKAQNPQMEILNFKRGKEALSAFIVVAPAQGGRTSVSYSALVSANDLPFPKDAINIAFDPDRPYLSCITGETLEQTLDFFRDELGVLGWSPWSIKLGARQPTTERIGEIHSNGAVAYFVRDLKQPLVLTLQRTADDKLKVEIRAVPAEVLARLNRQQNPAQTAVREPAPPSASGTGATIPTPRSPVADDLADTIRNQVQQAVREALADPQRTAPARTAPPAAAAPIEPLGSADNRAPIPLPGTAIEIEFNGPDGRLGFDSASSVTDLAQFHRGSLKAMGWRERPSVINRPNMVVLDFSKGSQSISLTIMQMGPKAKVTAHGSGLVVADAKPKAAEETRPMAAARTDEPELAAEQVSGLPVPANKTRSGTEKTLFRMVVSAQVPSQLPAVLAFYRRELGKLSWKEERADIKPQQAVLGYATAEGPATLTLVRKGDETTIEIALQRPAEAQRSGLMPKPGQAKILIGNMADGAAEITLNRQTYKVGVGVGAQKPDGPSFDLRPGKYSYSLTIGGKKAETDQIQVGANEIWGLMIGPGGVLSLRVY